MTIDTKYLAKNQMYYGIGVAAVPQIEVTVSTWVFIKQDKDLYYFCEWNDYMGCVDKSILPLVGFSAEVIDGVLIIHGITPLDELVDEIKLNMED